MINSDARLVRRPVDVSVCELMVAGLICEADVKEDGTVNEHLRTIAEREYKEIKSSRPIHQRRDRRPQTTSVRARIFNTKNHKKLHNIPLCCICLELEREVALLPCFHFCICRSCANKIEKCPICRSEVADNCRIWMT